MAERIYINSGWDFTEQDSADFTDARAVDLPHTVKLTPYDYFDESIYQMVCRYRKVLQAPLAWKGKSVRLVVEAAGHSAQVFLNGELICEHRCGYTAFAAELAGHLRCGADNELVIRVDSRESQNIPPFGYVIDYMTYGGLYREVYLEIADPVRFEDIFVIPEVPEGITPDQSGRCTGTIKTRLRLSQEKEGLMLRQQVRPYQSEELLAETEQAFAEEAAITLENARLWDIDHPCLYMLRSELADTDGKVLDSREDTFGFRSAVFRADGFYLNGRKVKIRGLNRHQSYPYVGYAMPKSMQVRDADILKNELGLNAVRTSHYPQSRYFIDRCDELGLLVFTESPGWQHLGDEAWKDQVVENVREMVEQYRNHPSIILWGVRINESPDDDGLYTRTNAAAHELDPTRQTGGVRYLKKSHLLEDVYTYNDFFHNGENAGCEPKAKITPDMGKGYLISEYNGHMFPTKAFDSEEHRAEQALRHANVLDAVAAQEDIAGCFGWCFADYNTHRDFGSGDRICYHGVTDMFRNPKMAAAVYAAQRPAAEGTVLEVSSEMNIGDHPTGNLGKIYIFTNADSVKMYKNDIFLKEYKKEDSSFRHMPCGPLLVDDFIGDQLITQEGFTQKQSEAAKYILNYSAIHGFGHLPFRVMRRAAGLMLRYRMTFEDAYRLYGKYIGNWGGQATRYRFDAIVGGEVVKTLIKAPAEDFSLRAEASHTTLVEESTYDVAAVRLQVVDENGNVQPFCNEAVTLEIRGEAEIIGPKIVPLRGGCGGTYIRSCGKAGSAVLLIDGGTFGTAEISFAVETE